jgi:hypothetical protein
MCPPLPQWAEGLVGAEGKAREGGGEGGCAYAPFPLGDGFSPTPNPLVGEAKGKGSLCLAFDPE